MEFVSLLLAIVALMIATKSRRRGEEHEDAALEQVRDLGLRVRRLELDVQRLAARATSAPSTVVTERAQPATPTPHVVPDQPAPIASPVAVTAAVPVPPVVIAASVAIAAPVAAPVEVAAPVVRSASQDLPPSTAAPAERIGFEEQIGANWLNKLGIVILVLGIASFLAYQLTNLGP